MTISRNYDLTIAPLDHMAHSNNDSYFRVTDITVDLIEGTLSRQGVSPEDIRSVADYGCGYGRVYRALPGLFPNARLTAIDLMSDAVDFVADAFGGRGVCSSSGFDTDLGDSFDLVWLGSVFTHLTEDGWHALLNQLARHVEDGGHVVFTTHGKRSLTQLKLGPLKRNPHLIEAHALEDVVENIDERGFMFISSRPGNVRYQRDVLGMDVEADSYGFSFSTEQWVRSLIKDATAWDMVEYLPRGWGNNHDVAVIKRV